MYCHVHLVIFSFSILQESRKYRDLLGAFWDKVLPITSLNFLVGCSLVSIVP